MTDINPKTSYRYKELTPPVDLKHVVDKIWIFGTASISGNDKHFHLTTDFTTTLIFIFPRNLKNTAIFLSGPNTQNVPFKISPHLTVIGYRFVTAAGQHLFGIDCELTINKGVNLRDLFPVPLFNKIRSETKNSNSIKDRISIINEFLRAKYEAKCPPAEDEISDMIGKMISSKGNIKLEDFYPCLDISPRQFQRKFHMRTGLSPKEFCRIVRFHNVTRKLMKNDFRHFDVLVESGYYDQSHYYREFKEFTGMLPCKYVTRQKKINLEKLI